MPKIPDDVRIQSDGTGMATVVTTAGGVRIQRIRGVTVRADDPNGIVTADLEISMPIVDMHASPKHVTFVCECCGQTLEHKCYDPMEDIIKTLGGKVP